MKEEKLYHVWSYTEADRLFWQEHLEDWVPARIFDSHTHVNEPQFRLKPPTEAKRKQFWVNEVNEPIGAADAERCHRIVYPQRSVSCLAFGHPNLAYDLEKSNASLQFETEKRGWYSLAVVRPQWDADKVEALIRKPGVLGVKVYYALISDDPVTRDKHLNASIFEFLPHHQLKLLDKLGAWVTLHAPKAERLGHPDNIREIREIRDRYPNIVLVLAHLGRCYTLEHAKEAFPALAADKGLFFDNSAVLNPEVHRLALETFGPERIMYGTDNPIFYMRGRRQWEGNRYRNRTSYPFYFNKEREDAETESKYTLYMYEALRALKSACIDLDIDKENVERIFSGTIRSIISNIKE